MLRNYKAVRRLLKRAVLYTSVTSAVQIASQLVWKAVTTENTDRSYETPLDHLLVDSNLLEWFLVTDRSLQETARHNIYQLAVKVQYLEKLLESTFQEMDQTNIGSVLYKKELVTKSAWLLMDKIERSNPLPGEDTFLPVREHIETLLSSIEYNVERNLQTAKIF